LSCFAVWPVPHTHFTSNSTVNTTNTYANHWTTAWASSTQSHFHKQFLRNHLCYFPTDLFIIVCTSQDVSLSSQLVFLLSPIWATQPSHCSVITTTTLHESHQLQHSHCTILYLLKYKIRVSP
jgi:hypothetical protein